MCVAVHECDLNQLTILQLLRPAGGLMGVPDIRPGVNAMFANMRPWAFRSSGSFFAFNKTASETSSAADQ